MDNTRKTVLITGCSAGGAGSALALEFARRGLHVFATTRNVATMAHLADNPHITLLQLDITSSPSIAKAVHSVTAMTRGTRDGNEGGRLDYLVNNAGAAYTMPFLDTDIAAAKAMFDTNVWGFFAVTQAFAPLLISAQGHITNICSVSAYCNSPWMGSYGASKAAMLVLSETLRLELAPLGVSVNSIVTGSIDTPIMAKAAGGEWALPADSLYGGAEKFIRERATGGGVPSKMSPEQFAQKVVGDVLGGVVGMTWRGAMASVMRLFTHVPVALLDMVMAKDTGLNMVVPAATKP